MDATPEPLAANAPGRVPWRGRDLVYATIAGIVLALLLMVPLTLVTFGESRELPLSYLAATGIVIYVALFASTWYFALKRRGGTLTDAGFRTVSGTTLLKMVPVTIGLLGLIAIVVAISGVFFGDVPTAQDQMVGDARSIAFSDFVWLFTLGAIAAPVAEEFLFRGILYQLLRNRLSMVAAVIVSALAFALLHLIIPLIPALLVMGVVLAALAHRYDSLYPAIVVHALNNAAALIALYAAIGRG